MGYFMDFKGYFDGYLWSKHGLSFISTKGYLRSLKKTFPVRATSNPSASTPKRSLKHTQELAAPQRFGSSLPSTLSRASL